MKQKISVRAIIKDGDKLLLVRRAIGNPRYIGQWEVPGGKLEFGEDPLQAVRREVSEELGGATAAAQLLRAVSWMDTIERSTQHIILVYLTALSGSPTQLTLSDEHDKFVWRTMSEIQLDEINALTLAALKDDLQVATPEARKSDAMQNNVEETTESTPKEVIVYTDGGSRGNPGPSASGYVIQDKSGRLMDEGGKYLGVTTNNQAEYQAVELALERALRMGARVVDFRLDSQLVANQMTGVYKIKNRDLWPIHVRIKQLIEQFEHVNFTHVRREFNKEADAMVNKILDEHVANKR